MQIEHCEAMAIVIFLEATPSRDHLINPALSAKEKITIAYLSLKLQATSFKLFLRRLFLNWQISKLAEFFSFINDQRKSVKSVKSVFLFF